MLTIVVPMAGRGTRFSEEGFKEPKPLIPVLGRPMIQWVIENLRPQRPHRFVFVCLEQHLRDHALGESLRTWAPGCEVLSLDHITQGAACTVLLARRFFENEEPLVIANCDQWIDASMDAFLAHADQSLVDGLIMTMRADEKKWSYVQFDAQGQVVGVREKEVVSPQATVGIYYYRRGRDFARAADQMIAADERVNGEFYVAPVYNWMLAAGKRLEVHPIGEVGREMWGLGIPPDLAAFIGFYSANSNT